MKQSLFVTAMVAATTNAYFNVEDLPTVDVSKFTEGTMPNKVDHFDYLDDRTFEQRYWKSDEYYTGTGPLFIYICGEYRCSVPDTRLYPFMVGAQYGAEFLVVEHRFYGESQPFDDWSLENLAYLNSEQALADLAQFIGRINVNNNEVVVIGGSYPGAMSAWFRERYPHLAVGSWSSSGVVQPVVDFWHFDEQVYSSAIKSGSACTDSIRATMDYVTEQGHLREDGNTDTVIDQTLTGTKSEGMRTDDWMFYYADIFVESVQYGNRSNLCDMLAQQDPTQPDATVLAAADFGTNVAGVNPPDYDTRLIRDTTIDTYSSARPWTFQYCTEYGWFQVPSQIHSMRSDYLDMPFWPAMCERAFPGLNMDNRPKARESTIDQGGFNMGVENVFFANGVEDPWRWATHQEQNKHLNQISHTSDCDNCGHCVELYTPTDSDPKELKETRQMIADWIDDLLTTPESRSVFLQ